MYEVDLEKFWSDDEVAHRDNCFCKEAPQAAFGILMSDECVFAELNEDGNPWIETERQRRIDLNRRYNDKAEKIVGRRLLKEDLPLPAKKFPYVKRIGEIFGGNYVINENSEWLEFNCNSYKELEDILDRADKLDIHDFMFPENWYSEKKRLHEEYGLVPHLYKSIRGPVTLATSIFGAQNLIYLILDEPELAKRFSDTITEVILKMTSAMDEETGPDSGFSFYDDNCCLLTPQMYEFFAFPILEKIFRVRSPKPEDRRYQHSDSSMGHLLPILGRLDLTGCNFGPDVLFDKIRENMPNTRVDGCLSPLVFMDNDEEEIISQIKRDCKMAKETKGINISTAGSINNGSLLTSMRAAMYAVQKYGRY